MAQARHDLLRDQAIVGDSARCIRQISDLVDSTGMGRLRCVFDGDGAVDRETTLAGMTLFAQEVLPACRTIESPVTAEPPPTR